MNKNTLIFSCLALLISLSIVAAPYHGDIVDFPQPDGSTVQVKLYGDEYYMRGESLDGYTLVRDDRWMALLCRIR